MFHQNENALDPDYWRPTPDTIDVVTTCRSINIPENMVAVVYGAIEELTVPDNWAEVGLLTPQATADSLQQMLSDFVDSECASEPVAPDVELVTLVLPYIGYWWI